MSETPTPTSKTPDDEEMMNVDKEETKTTTSVISGEDRKILENIVLRPLDFERERRYGDETLET